MHISADLVMESTSIAIVLKIITNQKRRDGFYHLFN